MRLSVPIYQLKRQAKRQARQNNIPFNQALDQVAKIEGFLNWGLLAAFHAQRKPTAKILDALQPGDLVLLGARPGHGKTLMGLELIIEALKGDRTAAFYSLEYSERDVENRFSDLGFKTTAKTDKLTVDTSDQICAAHIIETQRQQPRGSVAVIDYMQLLDQDRTKPALECQLSALKAFAEQAGQILILISQIDRFYDPQVRPMPGIGDVRLPNAINLNVFTKTVFLQDGCVQLKKTA
ncbi:MAG: DNA helicase [Paracoccaceae bacterium]